jgi:drug/metabolite transporter (DMT)-like permease
MAAPPGRAARTPLDSPIVLMVLATLFWAGNQTIGKIATYGYLPPFTLAFWRWVLALAIVAALFWREAKAVAPAFRGRWTFVTVLALLSVSYFNLAQYWALTRTSTLNAGVIMAGMPAAMFLASRLLGNERAAPLQMIGAAASMAGVLLVVLRGAPAALLSLEWNLGDLASLSAIVTWAIYAVLFKRLPLGLDQRGVITWMIAIGTLGLVPFYAWDLATEPLPHATAAAAGMIVYVAIFPSVLSLLFWNRAVVLGGANLAGIMFNLTIVFIAIFAIVLLGETAAWYHGAGMALVFGGILLSVLARPPLEVARAATPTPHAR